MALRLDVAYLEHQANSASLEVSLFIKHLQILLQKPPPTDFFNQHRMHLFRVGSGVSSH